MKIRILVYSRNQYFINAFSTYTMERNEIEFQFSFFTEKLAAMEYFDSQKIDGILADQDFWIEDSLPNKFIKIAISDRTKIDRALSYYELNIYQRGISILEDLRAILASVDGKSESLMDKKQKIISFYSPQGGTGKTTLAYICAVLCAKKGSSAYLNMEEFGYTEHLYQVDFMAGMEDILFAMKDGRDFTSTLSNIIVRDKRNVFVFPIMKNMNDFLDMKTEHVEELIKGIITTGNMEYLLIDMMGELSDCNKKIMELSDRIFWIFNDDAVGIGKMERMKQDQSIQEAENYTKSYFIINKARLKEKDALAVRIPFSESLSHGADIEMVLSGNRDFYLSCMELIKMIDG